MRARLLFSLVLAHGAVGCGGDDDTGGTGAGGSGASGSATSGGGACMGSVYKSCTQYDPDGAPSECLEVDSSSAQTLIDVCAADDGATVSEEPCDRTGSQGGCMTMISGTCQIVWDYDAASAANEKAACEALGGTYVPVP